jgi:lipoate-protein ligase A
MKHGSNTDQILIRLLPYAMADGPHNMAADEVLLLSAAAGQASLRFYGWTTATVSLGYFQRAEARLVDPRLASLPWVRRPTGGATLVHHHELTYALALPLDLARPVSIWMRRMHEIIAASIETLRPPTGESGLAIHAGSSPSTTVHAEAHPSVLCFHQQTPGDLLCKQHKILGSAQRKHRLALLQHGGILLSQSEHTPTLPGVKELLGMDVSPAALMDAILQQFQARTGWRTSFAHWTDEEQRQIDELAREKYASLKWNGKR